MSIDLKNLQKLINICRKSGVLELEHGDVKIKLSSGSFNKPRKLKNEDTEAPAKEYSNEDLTFWSSGGIN